MPTIHRTGQTTVTSNFIMTLTFAVGLSLVACVQRKSNGARQSSMHISQKGDLGNGMTSLEKTLGDGANDHSFRRVFLQPGFLSIGQPMPMNLFLHCWDVVSFPFQNINVGFALHSLMVACLLERNMVK
jgi:hypothetical protein